MRRSAFLSLILFFTLLYTQGLCHRAGVPKAAVEGVLFLLPVVVLVSWRGALRNLAPGFLFLWFYVGWSICACIYHGEGAVRGLLHARHLVAAYVVFWAVWNSRFTAREIRGTNTAILGLFLLQVASAVLEGLVLGLRAENRVGTLGYQTGTIAALFPMFAFGCMLALFLHCQRLVFLVAGFSFFLVGYASGKLALYLFIPTMLVLGLITYAVEEGLRSALRRGCVVALVALCALPFMLYLLSHTRRTQALQEEPGVYNKIASFITYVKNTHAPDDSWYTGSRTATSLRVIEETFRRSPMVFLFGQGTRVLHDVSGQESEGAYDEYGIIYGIVGWSADALTVGWPAMFAQVGFYLYLFHLFRKRQRTLRLDPYWKAVSLMVKLGFLTFLISYFLYSNNFTVGGWLSGVYLYLLAVLLAPQYRKSRCRRVPEEWARPRLCLGGQAMPVRV